MGKADSGLVNWINRKAATAAKDAKLKHLLPINGIILYSAVCKEFFKLREQLKSSY